MNSNGIAAFACTLALLAPASHAATAFAITAFNANGFGKNLTVNVVEGFRFRPNQDIYVQEVGFYDSFSNGLIRSYKVGIVAPDNTILGSAIIPAGTAGRLDGPNDPGGDLLSGAFRYTALDTPLHLVSGGTYALAAFIPLGPTDEFPGSPVVSYNNLLTVSGPGLGAFFDCRLASSGGCRTPPTPQIPDLRYPSQFSSGARYLNFTFMTAPVPLPASGTLMAGALAIIAMARARRG